MWALIEEALQKYLGWYDDQYRQYPFVATLLLLFLAVGLPFFGLLVLIANFDDIGNALRTVLDSGWLKTLSLLFLVVAACVFLAVVGHREIWLLWKTVRFRLWCARQGMRPLASEVANGRAALTSSWRAFFEDQSGAQEKRQKPWLGAARALTHAYFEGQIKLRSGSGTSLFQRQAETESRHMLPSNFLLYAHCVGQIMASTLEHSEKSEKTRVVVRTVFSKDLARWFNVQAIHSPLSYETAWCTADWWETYRKSIHRERLKGSPIALLRLHRIDVDTVPQAREHPHRDYLRLCYQQDKGRPEASPLQLRHFLKAKASLVADGLDVGKWTCGVDALNRAPAHNGRSDIQIHPILVQPDSAKRAALLAWNNSEYWISQAYQDFKRAHEVSEYQEGQFGAWAKYCFKADIKQDDHIIRNMDDFFVVEFIGHKGLASRFGVSLEIEEHNDIAGIRLLSHELLETAVQQFDAVWRDPALSMEL